MITPSETMEKCTKCGLDRQNGAVTCNCLCMQCKDIIFDHVLAYCQSFLKNYTVLEVAKSVECLFTSNDVTKARDMLRNQFMEKLSDLDIVKVASRRSSNNRSHIEANAYDVTEATFRMHLGL